MTISTHFWPSGMYCAYTLEGPSGEAWVTKYALFVP